MARTVNATDLLNGINEMKDRLGVTFRALENGEHVTGSDVLAQWDAARHLVDRVDNHPQPIDFTSTTYSALREAAHDLELARGNVFELWLRRRPTE